MSIFARALKEKLKALMSLERPPVFILGAPGVGKSMIVAEVAKELGMAIIDLRALLLDPTDIRGIPAIKGDTAIWLKPVFLPDEKRDGEKGILFLDELNAAPPLVQASCYQLILNRRVGEYIMPKGWRIIAAGNRHSDLAITNRMPTPLVNRFHFYTLEVSFEDWKHWAYDSGVNQMVISFLNFKPELLFVAPKDRDTPFPTPRSWEHVSNIIGAIKEPDEEDIAGSVGPGPAREFHVFMRIYKDLPSSAEDILSRDVTFKALDKQFALNGMLIQYFKEKRKLDKDVADAVIRYSYNVPKEAALCLVRDCLIIDGPAIGKAKEFPKWSKEFSGTLNRK